VSPLPDGPGVALADGRPWPSRSHTALLRGVHHGGGVLLRERRVGAPDR